MKLPNPLKRKPGLKLEFECTACDHSFEQNVRWLYLDPEIIKQNQGQIESPDAGGFLVPQRITCPHCQAVDQFKFAPSVFGHATTALLKGLSGGKMDPDDPIQFVRFGLADGRKMHPREAVEMYVAQVAEQPEQPELRVKYANTLCTLGYREEAEAEYRTVLGQDSTNLDALLNLAALLIVRDQEQEGYDYLRRLIACAGESDHPQRTEYVEVSQGVLDGDLKIEGIDVFIHFTPADPGKSLPVSILPPPTVRFEPSQKPRRQHKPKRKRKKRRGKQPPRN
jgi:tetratricopeptide (TPR) repeat protein